ncbi:MAG: hypothetical protein H6627_00020 [Calditrichae bacterium]|nr:hypothetical protein [Calditrichia bacterium]
MHNILGFRQYLKSENSYKDLEKIITERDSFFPTRDGFVTIVAMCGDDPSAFIKQKKLDEKVVIYPFAAWEENAQKVAGVYKKSKKELQKVQLIHYSNNPEGLTYPLELLVEIAKLLDFKNLAVSDSDFQMPYKELRRAYDFHIAISDSADEALITYPRRKIRALDFDKYPINRLAMEDLENMYIYMLSDLNTIAQKADFQSGLSITNSAAHYHLDFTNVGSWIGNLHMAIQVIHNKGRLENNFIVETNVQNESTINFDVQCAKIDQLYKYYLIPLSNICLLASDHPERYLMPDWTADKTKDEIKNTIDQILEMYLNRKKA